MNEQSTEFMMLLSLLSQAERIELLAIFRQM
jgi:hypothetical protein